MSWLVLIPLLELSYLPAVMPDPAAQYDKMGMLEVKVSVEADIVSVFYIRGELCVSTLGGDIAESILTQAFHPTDAGYLVEAGLRLGELSIGYRHYCQHPLMIYGMYFSTADKGYQEIYLRLGGSK